MKNKEIFLLAYYVSRPKDPKMTRIAGYSNQPNNMDYVYSKVYPETLECMKRCDILGFVDISGDIERNQPFVKSFGEKPVFYGHHNSKVRDLPR